VNVACRTAEAASFTDVVLRCGEASKLPSRAAGPADHRRWSGQSCATLVDGMWELNRHGSAAPFDDFGSPERVHGIAGFGLLAGLAVVVAV
jgi:hypothetical protein